MRLTQFSDYSLRVLLYLAIHPERWVPLPEISRAYGVSQNHLVKVAQTLQERGYVESLRGRGGGLRLAKAARSINVGAVVRATEPHFDLVECFNGENNTCPIDLACGFRSALLAAQKAFLRELNRFTLADFEPRAPALIKLWNRKLG
jgi:Rrf2 family nitric oxide-sensitive transcriptional repressor